MFKIVVHVYVLDLIITLLTKTQGRVYSGKVSWECVLDTNKAFVESRQYLGSSRVVES